MTVLPRRPRLAIIGGGGAMGRLFARLLCVATRELYLFDYFDVGSHASSLGKTIDDVRLGAGTQGLHGPCYSVDSPGDSRTWVARPANSASSSGRALLCLASSFVEAPLSVPEILEGSLTSIVDRCAVAYPGGCTVFAGLPADAETLLPRADVTLLAIGIEGQASFAEAVRYYAPWFHSSSLVVDLGSTKTEPLETLCQVLDPGIGLLGAHPLFGPTVSELTGLIVASVEPNDGRPRSPWHDWFLERLVELHLIVTPTTAQEHDDAMSFVQALVHFTLLSFAYTFVRLDRDPVDLLAFRTPVFEPLLYLAARVAHLASTNPDTYRSIQTHTARPDVRVAFLEAAKEILQAIERSQLSGTPTEPSTGQTDPLAELFARYGSPWSPDRRDRRERQRREHFLEMGARLVDGLNQLRQDVVAAAGQVRAIEERRVGQPPRVLIGVVDLDLLDPGRQDVASRIRLRPVNLLLGSVQGGENLSDDGAHDHVIPLARARILDDAELLDWLLERNELVEQRTCEILVPDWFDRNVLRRLLKGLPEEASANLSRVWDVQLEDLERESDVPVGKKPARITLLIVLHPAELVATRRNVQESEAEEFTRSIRALEMEIDQFRRGDAEATIPAERARLVDAKDRLKRQRKQLIDRRTTTIDREVRRLTRLRVHAIYQSALAWLDRHGCSGLRLS